MISECFFNQSPQDITFFCSKNIDLRPNWGECHPLKKILVGKSFRSSPQRADKIFLLPLTDSTGHVFFSDSMNSKYLISLLIISFLNLIGGEKNENLCFLKNFLTKIFENFPGASRRTKTLTCVLLVLKVNSPPPQGCHFFLFEKQ